MSDRYKHFTLEERTSIAGLRASRPLAASSQAQPKAGSTDRRSDRIDAAMLARMAAMLKPDLRPVKSEALAQLSELVDEASTALINTNPDLKAKYDQLIAAGKPAKLAITAIMRKLVVMANALLRENRPCAETRP